MDNQFLELLKYFIIYSMLGWVMESVFRSICERKLINTGFLKGPFCPIYGIGAMIMIVFLKQFQYNIVLLFFMSFVVLTIWEYVVGVFLEKVFNTKYWDYSNHKINFQGRICLTNSIYWGILGVVFICYIHPFISEKLLLVPEYIVNILTIIITTILIVDIIISVLKLKNLSGALQKIEQLNLQIKEKLEEMKQFEKAGDKKLLKENLQEIVLQLTGKKNQMLKRLYKRVYRLKKAFPAIDTAEIREILNKKIEINEILNKKAKIEEKINKKVKKHKNK